MAGLITAWNANALFICLKLASAVAAGCTVVVKPSELSALQTQVLVAALHEAKLPKGRGEGHPEGLDGGFFAKPPVFVNVKNDMTIAREEIFGPVLCVIAYDSEEEAIRIANDSKYGLHGAVFGTDRQRARRVASQLRAGRVVINRMTDDSQAPWSGFKYSGVGREYGRYGIEAFVEPRAVLEV